MAIALGQQLKPSDYETIVKDKVAKAEDVVAENLTLVHYKKQAANFTGKSQQAAVNRLIRVEENKIIATLDKQMLNQVIEQWKLDGEPTHKIVHEDRYIGLLKD